MSEQIFISYRREGGDVTAKLICEALKNLNYTVFYDFDSISGGYFDSRILDAIKGCDDFVLVLPPHSLDRCVNEDDWVRQEIRHALLHKKNIVPILLPGFEFPKNMPSDIAEITRFNGVHFVMAYFEGVIDAVVDRFTTKPVRKIPSTTQEKMPAPKASAELGFELNKEGNGYIVKIGKCTDVEIVIPRIYNGKAVTAIGDSAFKGHTSLVNVSIPNSVTSIGESAFSGCSLLESITIPNSVTSIGKWAFEDCTALNSITIPKNVTSIGARLFLNCQSLTSIHVDEENNFYRSYDGHLYTKNMKTLVSYAIGRDETDFVLADSVTRIEDSAFSRCTALTGVTIPGGITSIGDFAFYNCTSLSCIAISDSITKNTSSNGVTSIGESAFSGCSLLESITIPNCVTSIGKWAFQDCSALTSVTIPKNVSSIGARAFLNCQSLTSIDVDEANNFYRSHGGHLYTKDMKTLVSYAIGRAETTYVIPDGVTGIEDSAFSRCTALTSVTIPNGVTRMGEFVFYRCASLTSLSLPNSLTSIGDYAFKECAALVSISLPNGLINIGEDTFRGCTSLASITLPNSVMSIGEGAFSGCSKLESITIPNNVTSIGKWAFQDCTSITNITIPKNVTNIGARAFLNCSSISSIHVSFWNRCYRSRAGHLYTKNMDTLVSYAIGSKESSFVIPDSVTSIADSAFSRCSAITKITIPRSVTSIGEFAFNRCTSLKSINYIGTVEMWKKCSTERNSFNKIAATVIHCINGDATL